MKLFHRFFVVLILWVTTAKAAENPVKNLKDQVITATRRVQACLNPRNVGMERGFALSRLKVTLGHITSHFEIHGFAPLSSPTEPILLTLPSRRLPSIEDAEVFNPHRVSGEDAPFARNTILIQHMQADDSVGRTYWENLIKEEESIARRRSHIKIHNALGRLLIACAGIETGSKDPIEHLYDATHCLFATARIELLNYDRTVEHIVRYLMTSSPEGDTFVHAGLKSRDPTKILPFLRLARIFSAPKSIGDDSDDDPTVYEVLLRQRGAGGFLPIHLAVPTNNMLLIAAVAAPYTRSPHPLMVLRHPVYPEWHASNRTIRHLLRLGIASPHISKRWRGPYPLHQAAIEGRPDLMQMYLRMERPAGRELGLRRTVGHDTLIETLERLLHQSINIFWELRLTTAPALSETGISRMQEAHLRFERILRLVAAIGLLRNVS